MQQLYTLQLREKELASKVTNDHPQLQEVRQQIAQAEAVLSKEKTGTHADKNCDQQNARRNAASIAQGRAGHCLA